MVKCWGRNDYGQLGDGTIVDKTTPLTVSSLSNGVAVSGGTNHTCSLIVDGSAPFYGVKCWGWNLYGQLGDGTTTDRLTPVPVVNLP